MYNIISKKEANEKTKEMVKMVWRICVRQRKESFILNEIDNLLYAEEIFIDDDDVIILSKEMQKRIIIENFYSFADLTTNIEDIKKLQDITVVAVNQRSEEREIHIVIEGGV